MGRILREAGEGSRGGDRLPNAVILLQDYNPPGYSDRHKEAKIESK